MRRKDFEDDLKRLVHDYTDEAKAALYVAIDNTIFEVWNKANWWYARRPFYFTTVVPYTTGTVNVTQYSATVTGSGTTFTAAMVGRKLILSGDNQGYVIKTFVSTTEVTLELPYIGGTSTGKAYGIYKHMYRLNDRVMRILWMTGNKDRLPIRHLNERELDARRPFHGDVGPPTRYSPRGQTTSDFYNTGNVTIANGSATVTGSGTTFTEEMVDMVLKAIGDDKEYIINTVVSVTEITLNTTFQGTAVSAGDYAIGPRGTEQVELYPAPNVVLGCFYKGQMRPLKLLADDDVPELPYQWHEGILLGTKKRFLPGRAINRSEIDNAKEQYSEFLNDIVGYHNVNEDENPFFQENLMDTEIQDPNWWSFRTEG